MATVKRRTTGGTARKAAPATASRRSREEDDEEEEDEPPVKRRRDVVGAKKAAKASPRRSRDDDDDDDDEEEAPSRTSAKKKAAPRKAASRARPEPDEDEDEDDSPYYEDDDEDEDEEEDDDEDEEEEPPRRSKGSKKAAPAKRAGRRSKEDAPIHAGVRTGWGGLDQIKSLFSQFPDRMFLDEEAQLVRFLDPEPFAEFRQHWVPNEKGTGNRPYNCIEKDCPLCDIGVEASAVIAFNVVHINTGGEPVLKVLQLNITAATALKDAAKQDKACKGRIDRTYWSIYKSGKSGKRGKGQTVPHFTATKERDLEEDWEDIEPLTEAELDEFASHAYSPADIDMPSKKQLRQIAEGLMDDTDEDDD